MPNKILSINAGSSSLKVSLFSPSLTNPQHVATCTISQIGAEDVEFSSTLNDSSLEDVKQVKSHDAALKYILRHLFSAAGVKEEEITHVCNRVVHGGEHRQSVVIDSKSLHHLEKLTDLAPLHNGPSTTLIRSSLSALPKSKSLAYFDTTFHSSLPAPVYTFPLARSLTQEHGLRKYGFHGISYSFIIRSVSSFLNKPANQINLIALHLGSGASACAIKGGKSLDTSMSLTPCAGLPGATRSGSVDPTAILYFVKNSENTIEGAEEILNKESGWKALTGTSSFGDIVAKAKENPESKEGLAFDLLVDRILDYIGAYFVKLEGNVDALVFAGGIGEKSPELRERIGEKCNCLGFDVEKAKNEAIKETEVTAIGRKVLVVRTDEQLQMAWELMKDDEYSYP